MVLLPMLSFFVASFVVNIFGFIAFAFFVALSRNLKLAFEDL